MEKSQKICKKNEENFGTLQKLVKIKTLAAGEQKTRRTALDNIGNRNSNGINNVIKNKEGVKKEVLKDNKTYSLRNTKSRVDTHWGKNSTVGLTKLLRSDSIKSNASSKGIVSGPKTKETKPTVTSYGAVSHDQKAAVKVVKQSSINLKKESSLRREDSSLSRRSIDKIRAIIASKNEVPSAVVPTKLPKAQKNNTVKLEHVKKEKTENKLLEMKFEPIILTPMKESVYDIDMNDFENIFMLSEYVNDIYSYLFQLEDQYPIQKDHLLNQQVVTPKMRSVLLDWINEVGNQFRLIGETYHMAVGIIDRYLQVVTNTSKNHFQLVGVTALFIASKYEELYPADINDFVYITDNSYTKQQIFSMERRIMRALEFELSRPISLLFLRRFSKAAKVETYHHAASKYFLELCTIDYSMSHFKPSEVAAASLYLALQLFNKTGNPVYLWTETLKHYSRYTIENLKPIVKKIAKIVKNAPEGKQKAVYSKFESNKFENISKSLEFYGSTIDTIINSN